MLIKKENCFFTGIINALILSVPLWVVIGFTLWLVSKAA